jgi:protein-S-isoprenylcysteine O-methyltransferase Ste14
MTLTLFRMEATTNSIIGVCWIIFVAYWTVSAARTKQIAEHQSPASAMAHRIPVVLGFILLISRRLPSPMNHLIVPHTDLAFVSGAVFCVLGLLICIWARRTLAGNWSSDVTFKQNHELVRTGPYRFVRHPIYTGLLAMCLGTAIEAGNLRCWIALLLMGIGFWIKLSQEERLMMRHFPEAYPLYKKQVKALVPWIL